MDFYWDSQLMDKIDTVEDYKVNDYKKFETIYRETLGGIKHTKFLAIAAVAYPSVAASIGTIVAYNVGTSPLGIATSVTAGLGLAYAMFMPEFKAYADMKDLQNMVSTDVNKAYNELSPQEKLLVPAPPKVEPKSIITVVEEKIAENFKKIKLR